MRFSSPKYEALPLGDIRSLGWIQAQMQRDLHGFAGHLDELTKEASSDIFGVGHVRGSEYNAPPDPDAVHYRWWWPGETEGVWLDGLTRLAFLTGDAGACAKARRIVEHVLSHQEPDGYIGVYKASERYRHTGGNGELHTQTRLFTALLAYAEFTGQARVVDAVRRAVDLTISQYGPNHSYFNYPVNDGGIAHGLMFIDVLEVLFGLTGDSRYLQFAEFLFADFAAAEGMSTNADNRPVNLLDPAKPYIGHTPHTVAQLRALLFLAHAADKDIYRQCCDAAFQKLAKHITVSGACIGDESIQGRAPTSDMFYEYCAMTEMLASLQSCILKTGQLADADRIERLVFNAAQGARLADGMGITYLTQDNRIEATASLGLERFGKGKTKFSPTHEDAAVCCNPAAVKLLPYHVCRMFLRMGGARPGLAAVTYGPCRVKTTIAGRPVTITERTDYPFEDRVEFEIEQADGTDFTLEFRIPGWSDGATLTVNGQTRKVAGPSASLHRAWRSGDRIVLDLSAKVAVEESCDHHAVVVRGPLVFAAAIPDRHVPVKDYPLAGFHDYDVMPTQQDAWNLAMPSGPVSFEVHRRPENLTDPWAKSPIELRGLMIGAGRKPTPVTLVPMGCTALRRVAFPRAGGD